MKYTLKKTPTTRKQILVSDKIIERIDNEALPDYPTRPEFLAESIRYFTDKLMNLRSIKYEQFSDDCKEPLKMEEFIFGLMKGELQKEKALLADYECEESTPITAILTDNQLKEIGYFIKMDGPIKNLQEYCRISLVVLLDYRLFVRNTRREMIIRK